MNRLMTQGAAANNVQVIPATKRAVSAGGQLKKAKDIRVAAYGRVSTDELAQQTSYEGQKSYYTKLISEKEGWIFAGMYADEAISGTNRNHRTEFNQMMEDAMNGKIDYIITKSISRFARNTVDTLNCVRQLRKCDPPVGIFFEKENIDTLDATGELILTILSALAQEESNSISKNISWSIQKKFQEGIAFGNPRAVYGYTDGKTNREWVVDEEQAEVVRFIFDEFVLGKSAYRISKELNEKGIPSPKGTNWIAATVRQMLQNEKYVGDCEMQKTVTEDFLSHKTVKNDGEKPKYYVTDHHVPIISRTTWTRTQEILARRSESRKQKKEKPAKRVGKDIFENLRCGKCGAPFYRRTFQTRATHFSDERSLEACREEIEANGESPDEYYERYYYTYPVWRCSSLKATGAKNDDAFMGKDDPDTAWHPTYLGEGSAKCPSHFVYETTIKQSFMEMLYAIKRDYEQHGENSWIAAEFQKAYQKVRQHIESRDAMQKAGLDEQIAQLEEKMAQMQARLKEAEERGRVRMSPEAETYERLVEDLRDRLNEKKEERLQFDQEEQMLSEMKTNYDFFIRCVEALPDENMAGMKLNINGLDTEGSCLRDMDGKAREMMAADIRRGRRKMTAERVEKAPDFLEFEKGIYFAFNHHRCLSASKLIDNAQTCRAEFDFQKSCKVSAVVIAKRFAVALFINRQWILLNFFDGFQNKIALATI